MLLLGVSGTEYSIPATPSYILQEDGFVLLVENGDNLTQE
jgi:hypothetical protein